MRPVVLSENQQRQVRAAAAMLRFESRHDFLLDVARYVEINCRVRAPTKKDVDDAASATIGVTPTVPVTLLQQRRLQ
jgi:hypothetical protein